MYIKKLEIYGFKSFPYKVILDFSPGITAIVGPNGSGKSNLLDAIKWVLGEQSPKRLRVRELSELIYSGRDAKKIDFTEVKLTLSHNPPILEGFKDQEEISIIRKFYKDGEGEFYINNRPCRLKDIHFLFLSLGINSQSYGIIDQGEINKFLEVSAKERKKFLEDLAGVSKIKITEEETERNLLYAKENLLRISDLLKEVEKQYYHLQKQADDAKRYLDLREKLKKLNIKRILEVRNKEEQQLREIIEKIDKLVDYQKDLEINYREFEKNERELLKTIIYKEEELKNKRKEKEKIDFEIKKINDELQSLYQKERDKMQKIEREKIKIENVEERKRQIIVELHAINNRLNLLLSKRKEIQLIKNKLNIEYSKWNNEYIVLLNNQEKVKNEYNYIKNKKEQINHKIEILNEEKLIQEKESENLKSDLQRHTIALKKLEEEKIALESKYNNKTELIQHKRILLEELKGKEENLKLNLESLKNIKNNLLSEIKNKEENLKLINKFLTEETFTIPEGYLSKTLGGNLSLSLDKLNLLENFYGDLFKALVIDSWEDLEMLLDKTDYHLFIFAKDLYNLPLSIKEVQNFRGEISDKTCFHYDSNRKLLFTPQGFILRIKEKKKGYFTLKSEQSYLEDHLKNLTEELKILTNQERKLESKLHEYALKIREIEEDIEKYTKELQVIKDSLFKLETMIIKITEWKVLAEDKLQKTIERLNHYDTQTQYLNQEYENLNKKLANLSEELNLSTRKINEILDKKKSLEDALNNLEKDLIKIKTEEGQLIIRKNELQRSLEKLEIENKNSKFQLDVMLEEHTHLKEKIQELKRKKSELEEVWKICEENLSTLEKCIKEKQREREELYDKKRAIEKEKAMLEKKIHNLEIWATEKRLILENLQKELNEWLDNEESLPELENFENNLESINREIEYIKEELKNYQDINLASIKEFEEVKERYKNLLEQKRDLEESIKQIKLILEELKNKATKEILLTLEEVNKKLKEIFPLIFEKGQAELYLTEDDPLNAGLDIRISLPHKPIKHLQMLSGGEKALCVIAMLMAFYLTKPGPFCILDEVDAPLDDKNSIKFIKLLHKLKEKSQIILITHNHNVIKEVDHIIGVTMEERGVSKIVKLKINNNFQ
ncbi:MAG: AAA family ATPase [Caldimicrobium sp.]|nr:AAA family ATPase [Caldimicrobium sp.]MCX7872934.1 AAA family ATPase [Caldimicrobium sp.]MDW8094464.1 AAA family ATPase [Caldimicrobium sp.]